MGKKAIVTPQSATPKSTLMDKRAPKKANKSGKQPMMYSSGKHG